MLKQAQALYENMTRNAKALRVRLGFAAHGKEIRPGWWEVNWKDHRGERHTRFLECQDCKLPNSPMFHVPDALWREVNAQGILCPDCFAKRLGREFTLDMLDDHGMNREILFGYLLAKRENLSQGE